MNRLTARNKQGDAYYPECFRRCDGFGSSNKCDTCEVSHNICEELAAYEDTRDRSTDMNHLLETLREFVCNRCRYRRECRTQGELDTECMICGLWELIRKVERKYTVLNRFDTSNAGILMKKHSKIVLCDECEYMAENEHGRFCRMADGMTRWLEEGDGCSCGRKKE